MTDIYVNDGERVKKYVKLQLFLCYKTRLNNNSSHIFLWYLKYR